MEQSELLKQMYSALQNTISMLERQHKLTESTLALCESYRIRVDELERQLREAAK